MQTLKILAHCQNIKMIKKGIVSSVEKNVQFFRGVTPNYVHVIFHVDRPVMVSHICIILPIT